MKFLPEKIHPGEIIEEQFIDLVEFDYVDPVKVFQGHKTKWSKRRIRVIPNSYE